MHDKNTARECESLDKFLDSDRAIKKAAVRGDSGNSFFV